MKSQYLLLTGLCIIRHCSAWYSEFTFGDNYLQSLDIDDLSQYDGFEYDLDFPRDTDEDFSFEDVWEEALLRRADLIGSLDLATPKGKGSAVPPNKAASAIQQDLAISKGKGSPMTPGKGIGPIQSIPAFKGSSKNDKPDPSAKGSQDQGARRPTSDAGVQTSLDEVYRDHRTVLSRMGKQNLALAGYDIKDMRKYGAHTAAELPRTQAEKYDANEMWIKQRQAMMSSLSAMETEGRAIQLKVMDGISRTKEEQKKIDAMYQTWMRVAEEATEAIPRILKETPELEWDLNHLRCSLGIFAELFKGYEFKQSRTVLAFFKFRNFCQNIGNKPKPYIAKKGK